MKLIIRVYSTGKEITLDFNENGLIEDIKSVIEVETGVPLDSQLIIHNGRYIHEEPMKPLKYFGLKELSKLIIANHAELQMNASQFITLQAEMMIDYYKSNMMLLDELLSKNRPLAEAIVTDDLNYIKNYIMAQQQQKLLTQMQANAELARLQADSMNPENQKKIEEMIKMQQIDENLKYAEEEMPEAFIKVPMLYIDCSVNGIPMQAFIDTGAQSTIMSQHCADKLKLTKILDTRYKGIATGVGTGKIVGRIHAAQLEIGGKFFPFSITVIESDTLGVDMILGLDNLKRHRCIINLHENCLMLMGGEVRVPFLAEKDVVESFYTDGIPGEETKGKANSPIKYSPIKPATTKNKAPGKPASTINPPKSNPTTSKPDPAKPAQPVPAAQSENNSKVARIMQEGIAKQEAEAILMNFGGNLEMALTFIMQQKMGF